MAQGGGNRFQSTPPAREETCSTSSLSVSEIISIHSSRTGGDSNHIASFQNKAYFNPLLPHGRRPAAAAGHSRNQKFQSTPPAREETRLTAYGAPNVTISIHSSRTGGDEHRHGRGYHAADISIHSSRTGGDVARASALDKHLISIHSSRTGGDRTAACCSSCGRYFNPLLPHGRRLTCRAST